MPVFVLLIHLYSINVLMFHSPSTASLKYTLSQILLLTEPFLVASFLIKGYAYLESQNAKNNYLRHKRSQLKHKREGWYIFQMEPYLQSHDQAISRAQVGCYPVWTYSLCIYAGGSVSGWVCHVGCSNLCQQNFYVHHPSLLGLDIADS